MTASIDRAAAIAALRQALDGLRVTIGPHGVGYDNKPRLITRVLQHAKELVDALTPQEPAAAPNAEVLDRLLREAADAHFACGEWQKDDEEDFDDLRRIADAADAEIRRFVLAAQAPEPREPMRLFHVQDADRPMYVVARDWSAALDAWWQMVRAENPGEDIEEMEGPDGISAVARDDELLIAGQAQEAKRDA